LCDFHSCEIHFIMMYVLALYVGVRLYFTTTHDGQRGRPVLLAMVHARLPPGYSPSSAVFKPGNTIHLAHYRKGVWYNAVVNMQFGTVLSTVHVSHTYYPCGGFRCPHLHCEAYCSSLLLWKTHI